MRIEGKGPLVLYQNNIYLLFTSGSNIPIWKAKRYSTLLPPQQSSESSYGQNLRNWVRIDPSFFKGAGWSQQNLIFGIWAMMPLLFYTSQVWMFHRSLHDLRRYIVEVDLKNEIPLVITTITWVPMKRGYLILVEGSERLSTVYCTSEICNDYLFTILQWSSATIKVSSQWESLQIYPHGSPA